MNLTNNIAYLNNVYSKIIAKYNDYYNILLFKL